MRHLRERSYDRCLAHAVEFVRAHSPSSEVLIVGATTEAAAEVVRLACDAALIGVHAISLRNLARVLAEARLCASGLTPISGLGREALPDGRRHTDVLGCCNDRLAQGDHEDRRQESHPDMLAENTREPAPIPIRSKMGQ